MANIKPTRICTIDGCKKKQHARGWCPMHYYRWRRNGHPFTLVLNLPPQTSFANNTEWRGDCLIWTGSLDTHGYGRLRSQGLSQSAHRFAWEQAHGPIPHGFSVDHIFHCDRACVNTDHLRLATHSDNSANRAGPGHGNQLGVRNVSLRGRRYRVRVTRQGTTHDFGTYECIEEASKVAERARRDLFGEFAGKG